MNRKPAAGALALVAVSAGIAYGQPPTEVRAEPAQDAPLWVGVMRVGGLVPVARYGPGQPAGDGWDEPWPELFGLEDLRFDRDTGTPRLLPRSWMRLPGAGGSRGGDLPERYDWRRTRTAPDRWVVYAAGENATIVDAASLSLLQVQCSTGWALDLEETPEVATLFRLAEEDRWRPGCRWPLIGAAFSRPADAVMDETEVPGLDEIRRALNLVDSPGSERGGKGSRRHEWLGFYRFGGLLVGVAYWVAYEGEGYTVIEIEGDRGRIVAHVHGGGC